MKAKHVKRQVRDMAMEDYSGLMDHISRDIGLMEKLMVAEYSKLQMENWLKENGKKTRLQVQEYLSKKMEMGYSRVI